MSIKSLKQTVSTDDLATVKTSLRLDEDDDDALLTMLIKAARADVMGQVGEQIDDFFDGNEVFKSAVLVEVSHLYENRQAVSTQQTFEVPMVLYSLINSLKDDYRYKLEQQNQQEGEESDG